MSRILSPSLQGGLGGFAVEQKFILDRQLAQEIRHWARAYLSPDPHGAGPQGDAYTIHSLYLDTENFDVLRRTGSFGRGKYRIRRYGDSATVFLERKIKTRGQVAKRRTPLELGELQRLAQPIPDRRWSGFWFHRRILARALAPVCQVSYSRTARMAETGAVRLTLDEGVRAGSIEGLAFHPRLEPVEFFQENVILELKFRQRPPALFEKLIEQFQLSAAPASKYRIAGEALGFGQLVS
jgi:hypothetical protein